MAVSKRGKSHILKNTIFIIIQGVSRHGNIARADRLILKSKWDVR